jgi:hypothetical protein
MVNARKSTLREMNNRYPPAHGYANRGGEDDDMKLMKSMLLAAALVGAVAVSPAMAAPITFDDLSGDGGVIANGYSGLNWSNFGVYDGRDFGASGYVNGRVSGLNTAYNQGGTPASFSAASAFTLNSGSFTGAWSNGLIISVVGLVNGAQAYSDNFTVNTAGPSLHTFDWTNLSSVTFSSAGGTNAGFNASGNQFVLDNLTISSAVAAVPEPASWAMMILGMGAVGFAMRRRKNVNTTVRFA